MLELGAGASTLYWLEKGCEVTSIETDASWLEKVRGIAGESANLRMLHAASISESYLENLDLGSFDIIVNDFSGDRSSVTQFLISSLAPTGWIVWDNTDRAEYWQSLNLLRDSGFGSVKFFGLAPALHQATETTILSRHLFELTKPIRR